MMGRATVLLAASLACAVAAPAAASRMEASSWMPGHDPSKASGTSTSWMASTRGFPQWIVVDLGRIMDLRRVRQRFAVADAWSFRVEGSNDDYDAENRWEPLAEVAAGRPRTTYDLPVSGKYRYVRVYVMGSRRNRASSTSLEAMGPASAPPAAMLAWLTPPHGERRIRSARP